MRKRDRLIGILIGIVAGLVIVTAFVFLGSEDVIDDPGVSGKPASTVANGPAPKPKPKPKPDAILPAEPPIATVRVIGGAPPAGGPAHLDYRRGAHVRIRVVSDTTVGIELVGNDVSGTVPAGRPTLLEFKASKPGNFPLILTASHIDIAQVRVGEPNSP